MSPVDDTALPTAHGTPPAKGRLRVEPEDFRVDEVPAYAPSGTGFLRDVVAKHVKSHNNAFLMQNHGALCLGHDAERAAHNVEILEKCSLAYLLALCAEKPVSKIPFAIREIAFSKLRKDQKKVEQGIMETGGE